MAILESKMRKKGATEVRSGRFLGSDRKRFWPVLGAGRPAARAVKTISAVRSISFRDENFQVLKTFATKKSDFFFIFL